MGCKCCRNIFRTKKPSKREVVEEGYSFAINPDFDSDDENSPGSAFSDLESFHTTYSRLSEKSYCKPLLTEENKEDLSKVSFRIDFSSSRIEEIDSIETTPYIIDEDNFPDVKQNIEFGSELNNDLENKYNVRFSTDYVMNFLHEMEKDLERFEKKIDTETLKLFLRSHKESGLPEGKVFATFDGKYKIPDVIKIMLNCAWRKKWDKGMVEYENLQSPHPVVEFYRMANKVPFPFQNRDFISKRFLFKNNGVYYLYYSSAPKELSPPENKKFVRGNTLLGGAIYKRENGRIHFFSVSVMDVKLKVIPKAILKTFVPTATKKMINGLLQQLEILEKNKKDEVETLV